MIEFSDYYDLYSKYETLPKISFDYIYFANACYKVSEQNLDKTEEIETMVVPFVEAIEMVMDNRICCNSSAHGILRVARILGI